MINCIDNDYHIWISKVKYFYCIIYLFVINGGVEVSISSFFTSPLASSSFFPASLSIYQSINLSNILSIIYLIKLLYHIDLIYIYIIVIPSTTNKIPYYFLLYNTNTRSSYPYSLKNNHRYKVTVLLSILLLTKRTASWIKYDPLKNAADRRANVAACCLLLLTARLLLAADQGSAAKKIMNIF